MRSVQVLERWPDHGRSPLWRVEGRGGVAVDAATAGLEAEIAARLAAWVRSYDEDKIPLDGAGDQEWIQTGVGLLHEVRSALAGRYEVVVTEPWWGESLSSSDPVEAVRWHSTPHR